MTGKPIEPNHFSGAFVRMCARAGVRRVRLHYLRHTCASMLLAQGVSPRVVMEVAVSTYRRNTLAIRQV